MKELCHAGLLLLTVLKLAGWATADDDCTPPGRPHINCTIEKSCDESGPAYQYDGAVWPNKPLHHKFSPMTVSWPVGDKIRYYGGANVTWQVPQEGSTKYLKGYLLKFTSYPDVSRTFCRFFNLTQANWTNNDILSRDPIIFNREVKFIAASSYFVELSSIPRSPPQLEPANYVTGSLILDFDEGNYEEHSLENTGRWRSFMVYDIDEASHKVHMTFTLAPPDYMFGSYDVGLVRKGADVYTDFKDDVVVDMQAPHHVVTFDNVCEGIYRIEVQPNNKGPNEACLCKLLAVPGCTTCTTTITQFFNVTASCTDPTTGAPEPTTGAADPTTQAVVIPPGPGQPSPNTGETKSVPNGISDSALAGAIVGPIVAVILLIVIGYLVYNHKWKRVCSFDEKPVGHVAPFNGGGGGGLRKPLKSGDHSTNKNNNIVKVPGPGSRELHEKQRVFIIYNPDHDHHVAVVTKFANFLCKLCGCDVIFDKWSQTDIQRRTISEWLHEQITGADKIIIVNSEGAYRRWQASKESVTYEKQNETNPGGDLFLQAIRMLHTKLGESLDYSRYISTHFAYTPKECDLPTLAVSSSYTLMKHVESLFFHIHGINKDEPGVEQEAVGINENYMNHSVEGRDLYNAILAANKFQKTYPNWFEQTYIVRDRKDSGIDSIPADVRNGSGIDRLHVDTTMTLPTELPPGIYVPTPTTDDRPRSLPENFNDWFPCIPPEDLDQDMTSLHGKPVSAVMRDMNNGSIFQGDLESTLDCMTLCHQDVNFICEEDDRSIASLEV